MTSNQKSNCCGALVVFHNEPFHQWYECNECKNPCSPAERPEIPAKEISKRFGRAIERLGDDSPEKHPLITLRFVEEVMYSERANTHAGGRIEIHESDKEYHTEEIRFMLPRGLYLKLRSALNGFEINA